MLDLSLCFLLICTQHSSFIPLATVHAFTSLRLHSLYILLALELAITNSRLFDVTSTCSSCPSKALALLRVPTDKLSAQFFRSTDGHRGDDVTTVLWFDELAVYIRLDKF